MRPLIHRLRALWPKRQPAGSSPEAGPQQRQARAAVEPALPAKRSPAARQQAQVLAVARVALASALNAHPQHRQRLRHLVQLDQALANRGLAAMDSLPLEMLQRALEQLESLASARQDSGLIELRSMIALASLRRETIAGMPPVDPFRTAQVLETRAAVEAELGPSPQQQAALKAAYAAMAHGSLRSDNEVELQGELRAIPKRPATTA